MSHDLALFLAKTFGLFYLMGFFILIVIHTYWPTRKAGADRAATGENAVVVGCRRADVILGPIGIVMADALLGEITPAMAQAVAQSDARRILIPANRCDTLVVGVSAPIGTLVEQAAAAVLDGCRN